MRRIEFMRELSYLLQDLDEADREEALRYYNDYFEDAGPESEEQVAEELGSPEKIAAIIKDGLNESDRPTGTFTDTGYTDERFRREQMPERSARSFSGQNPTGEGNKEGNPYYYTSDGPKKTKHSSGVGRVILLMLLCLVALPILIPLAGAAIVLVLTLVLGAVVVLLGLGVSGIAIVLSGIVALGSGITKLFVAPAAGTLVCGAALLIIAVGILVAWFMGWVFLKAVPPFVNWLIRVLRRPFEKRRGRA